MQFININHPEQKVTFPQAVITGLGKGQGLFFPEHLAPLENVRDLLDMDRIGFYPNPTSPTATLVDMSY